MVLFDTIPGHHLLYLDINQHECSSKHLLLCSLIVRVWNKITVFNFWMNYYFNKGYNYKIYFFCESLQSTKQKKSTKNINNQQILHVQTILHENTQCTFYPIKSCNVPMASQSFMTIAMYISHTCNVPVPPFHMTSSNGNQGQLFEGRSFPSAGQVQRDSS